MPLISAVKTSSFGSSKIPRSQSSLFGWNNNPTVSQFVAAYKRLVVHNEVKIVEGTVHHSMKLGICMWAVGFVLTMNWMCPQRSGMAPKTFCEVLTLREKIKLEDELENLPRLSPYIGNIVGYIARNVCRMVQQRIPWTTCHMATIAETCHSALLNRKNSGGLKKPASSTT